MANLSDGELAWRDDTAFHEFAPCSVQLDGVDGGAFKAHVVGGRNATGAEERRDEGEDAATVLMFITDLDSNPDGPPIKLTAQSARDLAEALIEAAADAEEAFENGGRMVETIMQQRARTWRRQRSRR